MINGIATLDYLERSAAPPVREPANNSMQLTALRAAADAGR